MSGVCAPSIVNSFVVRSCSFPPLPFKADSAAASAVITTKAFLGLCHDPFHENRFASFTDDGEIRVWDIRKLNLGSVVTIPTSSKNLSDISWSTERPNLLASISKEDDFVNFWELQNLVTIPGDDKAKEFDLSKSSQCWPLLQFSAAGKPVIHPSLLFFFFFFFLQQRPTQRTP